MFHLGLENKLMVTGGGETGVERIVRDGYIHTAGLKYNKDLL